VRRRPRKAHSSTAPAPGHPPVGAHRRVRPRSRRARHGEQGEARQRPRGRHAVTARQFGPTCSGRASAWRSCVTCAPSPSGCIPVGNGPLDVAVGGDAVWSRTAWTGRCRRSPEDQRRCRYPSREQSGERRLRRRLRMGRRSRFVRLWRQARGRGDRIRPCSGESLDKRMQESLHAEAQKIADQISVLGHIAVARSPTTWARRLC
jgi:hypothetical protein